MLQIHGCVVVRKPGWMPPNKCELLLKTMCPGVPDVTIFREPLDDSGEEVVMYGSPYILRYRFQRIGVALAKNMLVYAQITYGGRVILNARRAALLGDDEEICWKENELLREVAPMQGLGMRGLHQSTRLEKGDPAYELSDSFYCVGAIFDSTTGTKAEGEEEAIGAAGGAGHA